MSTAQTVDYKSRADVLFREHRDKIQRRTDRLFAGLMTLQFLAGIVAAILISPRAWAGSQSHVHLHVLAALFLGGLIASLPIGLALLHPGRPSTRYVVATGQMLTSALLIHLSGGRIETHFHVFGSLAFLAFYRDWRVFVPATIVVALDHLIRGVFWPESVYGVLTASPWRSFEHAAWVIFENIFLIRACIQGSREMSDIAAKQASLEATRAAVQQEVEHRTAELVKKTAALELQIQERQRAEAQRDELNRQLLETSRRAGMSEVATGVLHNVGNVLNSVNVSAALVTDRVRQSDSSSVAQLAGMFEAHASDLPRYLTEDDKGKLIPRFLSELGKQLADEQATVLRELESLTGNIEHIKSIVAMQQSYARVGGVVERVSPLDLVEDALQINSAGLKRHGIRVERDYSDVPNINTDRQKVLQVLVNLIGNAKYALTDSEDPDKLITLRVGVSDAGESVLIRVIDNGVGIAPQHLSQIFVHGFTTRRDGHGFGLHSSSLVAKSLGAVLTATSPGVGQGAEFVLDIPLEATVAAS